MARLELIPMGEVSWLAANGWRMKAARRRCEPDAPMKSGIGVGMSGTWSDAPTDSSTLSKTSGLPSPSPPAEKTSARQDQAGKSGTGDDCKSLQGQLSRVVTERRSLWL